MFKKKRFYERLCDLFLFLLLLLLPYCCAGLFYFDSVIYTLCSLDYPFSISYHHQHSVNMSKVFTTSDVASHKKPDDLYIIVDGDVYDVTKFQDDHPGRSITIQPSKLTSDT